MQSRIAYRARSRGSHFAAVSRITRFANCWAASTKTGSFSVISACSGVLERRRRVQGVSDVGPSNVVSGGDGVVRFIYVYSPRRYRSGPSLVGQGNGVYAA